MRQGDLNLIANNATDIKRKVLAAIAATEEETS